MDGKYTNGTKVWFITRYDINSGEASDPREGEYQERTTGWTLDPRCKVKTKKDNGEDEIVTVPESRVFDTVSGLIVFLQNVMQKNVSSCWTTYKRYVASRNKAERSKSVLEQYRAMLGTGEQVQTICDRILRNQNDPLGLGLETYDDIDIIDVMTQEYNNHSLTYIPYTSADTTCALPPAGDGYEYVNINSESIKDNYYIAYINSKLRPEYELPVKITEVLDADTVDSNVITVWNNAVTSQSLTYAEETDVFIKATLVKTGDTVYFVRDTRGGFFSIPSTEKNVIISECRLDITGSLAMAARNLILYEDQYATTEEKYYEWVNENMTEDDIKIHYLPFTQYTFYHPAWVKETVTEAVAKYVDNPDNDVSDDIKSKIDFYKLMS